MIATRNQGDLQMVIDDEGVRLPKPEKLRDRGWNDCDQDGIDPAFDETERDLLRT